MKKELLEGLRRFDLRGMVDHIVSVDEYNSKIEDDAIVVAFYVLDEKPAIDLDKFIQNSGIDILDSEASDQNDKNNRWPVFVEFYRDRDFIPNFLKLLNLIENLTGPLNWRMKVLDKKLSYSINEDNLLKLVRLNTTIKEEVENFIKDNSTIEINLDNRNFIIENKNFEILAFGKKEKIYNIFNLNYKSSTLNESEFLINSKLKRTFPLLLVDNIEGYTILHDLSSNNVLISKLVD